MAEKTGVRFDSAAFTTTVLRLTSQMEPALKEAAATGAMALLNDAINVEPETPVWDYYLRGSGKVYINNEFRDFSKWGNISAESIAKRSQSPESTIPPNGVVASTTFDTPYAVLWHETEPANYERRRSTPFTHPRAGKKYLESKVPRFKEKYVTLMALKWWLEMNKVL